LPLLDLGNSMLEQPPQFIGHFKAVLRAQRFEAPVLSGL
jgi:hypothetical protein